MGRTDGRGQPRVSSKQPALRSFQTTRCDILLGAAFRSHRSWATIRRFENLRSASTPEWTAVVMASIPLAHTAAELTCSPFCLENVVSAAVFKSLLVSRRRLVRLDRPKDNLRGLRDLDSNELFVTDSRRLHETVTR